MSEPYPRTKSARQKRRDSINERALWRAHRLERSMKCGGYDGTTEPRHAGSPLGCKNDGSSCICECHDD